MNLPALAGAPGPFFKPICFFSPPSVVDQGGKACPAAAALEEWRQCSEQRCAVFYWESSAWGPCLHGVSIDLNLTASQWNGSAACATPGVQIRKVNCIKANAGPVVSKRWVGQINGVIIETLKHVNHWAVIVQSVAFYNVYSCVCLRKELCCECVCICGGESIERLLFSRGQCLDWYTSWCR